MATIVVETGSGSSTANSYISEAELATYALDRGVTLTGTSAVLIIQAMDYLESKMFIGTKSTDPQNLQWPRTGVEVDNFYMTLRLFPDFLKKLRWSCVSLWMAA